MKILFLSDNFPPEVNAPASRTYEHCKEWVKQGVDVTVITCVPNFPQGKVYAGYKNKWVQKETIDGIKVIRVWSYISSNDGFIKRILDFISYAIMAFWVGLFQKTDIIIGTSPQFFTAISARFLGLFKRKPWIMEVRDLWPESIAAVGAMSKKSFFYKLLSWIEKRLYKTAKKIVVVTNSFKDYIENLGIDADKIVVIKNGVDLDKFSYSGKSKNLLDELDLNNKFIVGYIGTHGMAHALSFIISSASKITNPNIQFILQGDGAEKQNLIKQAKELHLKNVRFLPFVSKQEIKEYLSILDVALVNLKRSDTFKTVIPSKIFENACMQKPILLGVEGESKEIIQSYNAGLCYIPEDENSFLESIEKIQKPNLYLEYQQGCSRLAKDYDRNYLASKMIEEIKKCIK